MKNYSGKKINEERTSMGTYCHEVNYEKIAVADLLYTCSFIFPLLVKKAPDL